MKKILITGSSGMLGIDLIELLRRDYDVTGTDIIECRNPAAKPKQFIKCDITNSAMTMAMVKKAKPNFVIHTAAWTDVDGCEDDRDNAMKINAEGTHNIALGCKEVKAVMHYISSDFVFDGTKNKPYEEDDRTNPLNVYGLSKLKGEESMRSILDKYFIIRTSWLFGKNGRNFVDIILDKIERKKELKIVVDQFGSPTYTKDLSDAVKNLISLSTKNKDPYGVFHFSNNGSCSWYRYAEEIVRIIGKRDAIILPMTSLELDRPAERPGMSILNTDKYSKLFNESPRDWQSALQDYLINERRVKHGYVPDFKK
ncbi:MAG: dTDP-4-dehydrorhamnose reductase [Candidatus Omnitrophica bacterium]|nr:dTDP-4-dehydrorhamnose reductase [Candidatus Omnitrophota bacterium]